MKKYSIEDYREWVEDGAKHLAKTDMKNGGFMDMFNVIFDKINIDEKTEVDIRSAYSKEMTKITSNAITWILVNNLQQIFAVDADKSIPEAITQAFSLGIVADHFTDKKELDNAIKLCLPRNTRL